MWQVLRRLQGEEYTPVDDSKGIKENLNHIARHSCKAFHGGENPNVLTEPYGLNVYPKLIRTLESEETELRVKALEGLRSFFSHKQEHVHRAVEYDAVAPLVRRLKDPSPAARALAGKCLKHIAATSAGLQRILAPQHEAQLLEAVGDSEPAVAVEALGCLAAMDHSVGNNCGTEALIHAGCIPRYIASIRDGPPAVAEHALVTLGKVLNVKEAFIMVLDEGAMQVLAKLLESSPHNVTEQACDVVAKLCFFSAGKHAAGECEVLPRLKPLLSSSSSTVRRSAAGALMTLTLDNNGKHLALRCGVVEVVAARLQEEADPTTQVNLLKSATNCAEAALARQQLTPALPAVEKLAGHEDKRLAIAAKRAASVITWKPGTVLPVI